MKTKLSSWIKLIKLRIGVGTNAVAGKRERFIPMKSADKLEMEILIYSRGVENLTKVIIITETRDQKALSNFQE